MRFQTAISTAGSRKTEGTWGVSGSPTGMAQVNLENENTRIVEAIVPRIAFVDSEEEEEAVDDGKFLRSPDF